MATSDSEDYQHGYFQATLDSVQAELKEHKDDTKKQVAGILKTQVAQQKVIWSLVAISGFVQFIFMVKGA